MGLWTWWNDEQGNPIPLLTGFAVAPTVDRPLIARLTQLDHGSVQRRFEHEHRCYIAWVGAMPAAHGWVATTQAEIGELELRFTLSPDDRYLWDFVTLPAWRGRSIYPRLLQAILAQEYAERAWIIHAPENVASRRGIQKAGFRRVGTLSFLRDGRPALAEDEEVERARMGAKLLHVSLVARHRAQELNPCWRCFIARRRSAPASLRLCGASCDCAHAGLAPDE